MYLVTYNQCDQIWRNCDCGTVGTLVASESCFESSVKAILMTFNCIKKTKIKQKRGQFFNFQANNTYFVQIQNIFIFLDPDTKDIVYE